MKYLLTQNFRFSIDESRLAAAFSSKITLGEAKTAEEKERIMEEWKVSSDNITKISSFVFSKKMIVIVNCIEARAKSEESVEGETTVSPISSISSLSLVDFDYPVGASVRSGADKISG